MPATLVKSKYSPEALSLLNLLKTKKNVWENLAEEADPASDLVREAYLRASALQRKQIPITAEEKLDAFRIMGFDPSPKQREIASDMHRVRIVRAGRRSGKTTLAAHEAVAVMLKKPGSFGWIVAPDYDLTFRCWEIVVAELDRLEARGLIKYRQKVSSKTSMRIVLDNGSVVEGQSCENADDLQGVGLDWLVIDEIAQVLPFVFLQMLVPALADRKGWAFLIGTPIGENWTEKEYRHQVRMASRANEPCDWSEWMFETWCNTKIFPLGENDPEIRKLQRTMPFEEYMEQVCAQPQKSRYVTYKEFNEDVHVRHLPFDKRFKVQLGIDPSTGVNPYAVAALQDLGSMVLQIDEYYKIGVTFLDVIEDLKRRPWWDAVEEAYIDDAWAQERENWRRHQDVRFSVRRAKKSAYITDSIPTVRNWLRDPEKYNEVVIPLREKILERDYQGRSFYEIDIEEQNEINLKVESETSKDLALLQDCARYFIDQRCIHTVDEFSGYMYKKRKRDDQNPSEEPGMHKDHLMDCAVGETLVTTISGEKRIDEIQIGELVLTRQGWKRVTDAWCQSRDANVVEVLFSNGQKFTATPEHRIWVVGKGWTTLDALCYNDPIITHRGVQWLVANRSSLTGLSFDDILNLSDHLIVSISDRPVTTSDVESEIFTRRFGNQSTDQYQTDVTFTTKTGIVRTTDRKISSASLMENTFPDIMLGSVPTEKETTYQESNQKQWSGTLPPKGVPGILSTQNKYINSESLKYGSVCTAEKNIPVLPRGSETDSAPLTADVISVVPRGRAPVYDLTVEDAHEFLADGILVSNCIRYTLHARKRNYKEGGSAVLARPESYLDGYA